MIARDEEGKLDIYEDVSKYLGFTLRNPNHPDKKIWSSPTNHSPFQSLHRLLLQINFFLL